MEIVWRQNLAVGVPEIDRQHQELFARVNTLILASKSNGSAEQIAELFRFLDEYVKEHFTFEEQLQRQYGYPRAAEHLKMHDAFIAKLHAFKERYLADGASLGLRIKVHEFVVNWLVQHISHEDKELAAYHQGRTL
jgi:hemerythrin